MDTKTVQTRKRFCTLGLSLWFGIFLSPNFVKSEILMLRKESEFICAIKDLNSSIFLQPPTTFNEEYNNVLMDNRFWNSSDWITNNSTKHLLSPVTDIRWKDFGIIYMKYFKHEHFQSVSVSLYAPGFVDFFLDDDMNIEYHRRDCQKWDSWIHYTIFLKDGNLYILENNEAVHSRIGLVPNKVVIKTPDDTYWKIHDYRIQVAEEMSGKPTKIKVPSFVSCLVLYANLCPHCQLTINDTKLSGKKLIDDLNAWQILEIPSSSGINLELSRTTNDNSRRGLWAIEFRNCSNFIRRKVEKKHLNRTCRVLGQNQLQIGPDSSSELKKELQCEDFLEKKYCKEYQYCENNFENCSLPPEYSNGGKSRYPNHNILIFVKVVIIFTTKY